MKTSTRENVLKFMKVIDTSEMNSNEFVVEYFKLFGDYGLFFNFEKVFLKGVSVSSISRSRRYIIRAYGIGIRKNADSEAEYIEEFGLKNKVHQIN